MTRAVRKSAFLNRCAYGQKEKIVFIRERAYVAGEVTLGEGANIWWPASAATSRPFNESVKKGRNAAGGQVSPFFARELF